MVSVADTWLLDVAQSMRPKPFSHTAAPLRPTTTAAPGNPPALMPRVTTRSIVSSRFADMPTVAGAATGSPPSETAIMATAAISVVSTRGPLLKNVAVPAAPTGRQDHIHTLLRIGVGCSSD